MSTTQLLVSKSCDPQTVKCGMWHVTWELQTCHSKLCGEDIGVGTVNGELSIFVESFVESFLVLYDYVGCLLPLTSARRTRMSHRQFELLVLPLGFVFVNRTCFAGARPTPPCTLSSCTSWPSSTSSQTFSTKPSLRGN